MDRFFRGFLAGVLGGVVMNIWDMISFYVLNFTEHRFLDWSAVILLGEKPNTIIETGYSLFVHLIWAGFLGIIFAFLIPAVTSRGLIWKGIIFGFISGFFIYAISTLEKAPHLAKMPIESVISNHFGGIVWGMTTAYALLYWERKLGAK